MCSIVCISFSLLKFTCHEQLSNTCTLPNVLHLVTVKYSTIFTDCVSTGDIAIVSICLYIHLFHSNFCTK